MMVKVKRIEEIKNIQDLLDILQVKQKNSENKFKKVDDKVIKVSELMRPPLERYIRLKYGVEDSDNIWQFFGKIFHAGLEIWDNSSSEDKKLEVEYKGWVISGRYDYYKEGLLIDYKTTSKKPNKDDYEKDKRSEEYFWQLQVYRWLLWKARNETANKLLNIFFVLGENATFGVEYEPLEYEEIEKQIDTWLDRHSKIDKCTDEERWKIVKYVVEGKEFDDFRSALDYSFSLGDKPIIEKVVYLKCEKYCNVSKFCPLYKGVQLSNAKGYSE